MEKLGALVVAAGKGSRFGGKISKQYLPLGGVPVLVRTLAALQNAAAVSEIVLVVGKDDVEHCRGYKERYGISKLSAVVAGGAERQHSVWEGLQRLASEWVIVHDGVRPFVTADLVERCWQTARESGAAVAAVPVKDTIKVADPSGTIVHTPDRKSLWAIQTPQAFRRSDLVEAHRQAQREGFVGTDDASLVERIGVPVKVVQGDYGNIKITTPEDLDWAEFRWKSEKGEERIP